MFQYKSTQKRFPEHKVPPGVVIPEWRTRSNPRGPLGIVPNKQNTQKKCLRFRLCHHSYFLLMKFHQPHHDQMTHNYFLGKWIKIRSESTDCLLKELKISFKVIMPYPWNNSNYIRLSKFEISKHFIYLNMTLYTNQRWATYYQITTWQEPRNALHILWHPIRNTIMWQKLLAWNGIWRTKLQKG